MRRLCWCCLCVGLLVGAGVACAQEGRSRGGSEAPVAEAQRLVRLFDFEDTNDAGVKIGRGIQMPRHWYVIGRDPLAKDVNFGRLALHRELELRPGYPGFNEVGFDTELVASGEFSLKLEHRGGDVGAFVEVGALPAIPLSDYMVTAKVKTRGLSASAVYVLAYLMDARGNRLLETMRSSGPVQSEGEWFPVELALLGEDRRAAYVGIEVHLVQPARREVASLGSHTVTPLDVKGEAWVEDVGLWQLPTVELSSQSALNTVKGSDRPRWTVQVRDMMDQGLVATVRVFDAERRVVAEDRRPIRPGLPTRWDWSPVLPGFGWYFVELVVGPAGGATSSRTYSAVLWLPEEALPVSEDARRFGVSLEGIAEERLGLACGLFGELGFQSGVWSAWDVAMSEEDIGARAKRLDDWISGALGPGGRAEVSFVPVPEALVERLGGHADDAGELFSQGSARWQSYVQPTLLRMGTYVRRWRVPGAGWGRDGYAGVMESAVVNAESVFRDWTALPRFTVPMSAARDPALGPASGTLGYVVGVPSGVLPMEMSGQLEAYLAGGEPVTLGLEVAGAESVSHRGRVADLLHRLLHVWRMREGVSVELPMGFSLAKERRSAILPDPLLGAYRNVMIRLSGRRVVAELSAGEGLGAWVMDGPRGGMLVARNERAALPAVMKMNLGQSPVVIDAFGNRSALSLQVDGTHHLTLGDVPVFVEGVDVALLRFRAGLALDRPFIESTQTPHERMLRVTNPWPTTINGRLTFTGPEGWDIRPVRHLFSLAPGRTLDLPVTFRFPINEEAGAKRLTARLELAADKPYDVIVETPMEVGLEHLTFEASVYLDSFTRPGHTDAVVSATVTNTSEEDVTLNLFAAHPNHPYAERLIPQLRPGATAMRTFRFPDATQRTFDKPVLVGVRETSGPAMLNKHLNLTDLR